MIVLKLKSKKFLWVKNIIIKAFNMRTQMTIKKYRTFIKWYQNRIKKNKPQYQYFLEKKQDTSPYEKFKKATSGKVVFYPIVNIKSLVLSKIKLQQLQNKFLKIYPYFTTIKQTWTTPRRYNLETYITESFRARYAPQFIRPLHSKYKQLVINKLNYRFDQLLNRYIPQRNNARLFIIAASKQKNFFIRTKTFTKNF